MSCAKVKKLSINMWQSFNQIHHGTNNLENNDKLSNMLREFHDQICNNNLHVAVDGNHDELEGFKQVRHLISRISDIFRSCCILIYSKSLIYVGYRRCNFRYISKTKSPIYVGYMRCNFCYMSKTK